MVEVLERCDCSVTMATNNIPGAHAVVTRETAQKRRSALCADYSCYSQWSQGAKIECELNIHRRKTGEGSN